MMPSRQQQQPPQQSAPTRNPFDHVERPSRSLFERVDSSNKGINARSGRNRHRSTSPDDYNGGDNNSGDDNYRVRRSNVAKPPPDHIDRYVPNRRNTRSPMPRFGGANNGGGRDGGRRPGARRDNSVRNDGGGRGDGGTGGGGGGGRRPKKTSDELDAEMADYWGDGRNYESTNGAFNSSNNQETNAGFGGGNVEEDVDMIE